MRALCLLALMLLAPGAEPTAAQLRTELRPVQALPAPFLFQRREQPGPGFTRSQLEQWLEAVSTHRPGESDDSARAAAALSPGALADILAAFERTDVPVKDRYKKIETLRRAAMLHTDIAMFAAGEGYLDEMNEATKASLHLGVALEAVDALKRETLRGPDPFVFAWWRAVAAILGKHREAVSSVAFMQRAVSQYPADLDLLLTAGTLHELLASPVVRDDSGAGAELQALRGSESENLGIAEQQYREALKIAPGPVEARVRLGRVLAHQQRYQLAIAELTSVSDQAAQPELRYYRDLALGEAEAGLHRTDAAREAYRRALATYPGAQSAFLALARLERQAGDRPRALDAVLRLLRRPQREDSREDPWREYFVATPARRAAEWLDELRAPLRRRP